MAGNIYFNTYEGALQVFNKAKDPFKGKPVNNNTRLISLGTSLPDENNSCYSVLGLKLHGTVIVEYFPDGSITLDSGGWRTHTTKERMNSYTPLSIRQENHIWYVNDIYLFKDGMIIKPGVSVEGDMSLQEVKEQAKRKKIINDYINKFMESLPVPQPSGGDCWFCVLRDEKTGKTLGDLGDDDHLENHIEEDYFVPSLLYNALKEAGHNDVGIGILGVFQGTGRGGLPQHGCEERYHYLAKRALRRYLYKRLLF